MERMQESGADGHWGGEERLRCAASDVVSRAECDAEAGAVQEQRHGGSGSTGDRSWNEGYFE